MLRRPTTPMLGRPRRSITRRALATSAVVLTMVMCVAAGVMFVYLRATITRDAEVQLRNYIGERLAREQLLFTQATADATTFARELRLALARPPPPDVDARFAALVRPQLDGTWRSPPGPDYTRTAQVFAGPQTVADAATRQLYVVASDMVTSYGRAWHHTFQDTYITTPQNGCIMYWPEVPAWFATVDAGYDMTRETYMTVVDLAHNPARTPTWTSVYYDPGSAGWLVSLAAPIDIAGRHVANFTHDVSLDELLERTESSSLPGAHNAIFRRDGQVITHGESSAAELDGLIALARDSTAAIWVTDNPDGESIVALGHVEGPDWYLVVIYPKALISTRALRAARFVFGCSMIALGLQLLALLFVMRRQIARPLIALTNATDGVRRGQFATRVEIERDDEIGALGTSFNAMTQAVSDRDHALAEHAAMLERRVADRTQELSDANRQLRIEMAHRSQMEIELRQAQKLESIGRLAAGIAHEINTPVQFVNDSCTFLSAATADMLALVATYRELVAGLDAPAPDVAAAVARGRAREDELDLDYLAGNIPPAIERALHGLARVSAIVLAMKDFAYPERGDRAPADLNRAITSTLIVAQPEFRDVAEIATELGDLPLVVCHLGEINQVVLNILVNAAHAIAARGPGAPGRIAIRTAAHGDVATIAIADNGCGIPDAVIDNIFDPFFTTKELGKGTGQGLTIARAVVDKHGGKLEVTSRVGAGTTFTISLPIAGSASRELVEPDQRRVL